MDVYRNIGRDALAQIYAEEVMRLGVTDSGIERTPVRKAEARITLAVIAERAGDHAEAVSQGQTALRPALKSMPSLRTAGRELSREFERVGHANDPDVINFARTLSTEQPRDVA